MKKILILAVLFAISSFAKNSAHNNAPDYPVVGRRCPYFILNDVEYYSPGTHVALLNFKGKWLVLDCWNRYCVVCTRSMPKTDSLARQFSEKVQFLLIGYTGTKYSRRGPDELEIKKLYVKLRKEHNLSLPIAYDSLLFDRFDISSCPFMIIVDPEGIVRGITSKLNADDLQAIIAGKRPVLTKAYRTHEPGSPESRYRAAMKTQ